MKKILAILAIFLILPTIVFANGMPFPPDDYDEHVYMPEQKAVVIWDGSEETLILSTKIQAEDLIDIAWVIPIESKVKPEVSEGDIQIFYDLAQLFRPEKSYDGVGILAGGMESVGVEVIEVKTVDIYNIAILKATSASALVDWLNTYDFATPEDAIPILQEYADQDNFYFIANRIDISGRQTRGPNKIELECSDEVIEELGPSSVFWSYQEGIENAVLRAMEYNTICDDAAPGIVTAVVQLKTGVSTPLKIEFEPKKMFYPQKISSLGEGDTNINVYVISDKPVTDSSKTLGVTDSKSLPDYFKEEYDLEDQNYATWLEYDGELSSLSKDSVFVSARSQDEMNLIYFIGGVIIAAILLGALVYLNKK